MAFDSTVFVVDDDGAVRDALVWLLHSAGLQVEAYATAEDFLLRYDRLRRGCLVLDVHLPGMDGFALRDELADRGSTLPVIFVSADVRVTSAERARRAGALDFLPKPFDDELLLSLIQHALQIAGLDAR
jgi:FixJ family two-component response regulator